jgi:hypothetical protein
VGVVTSCSIDSDGYQLGQAYVKTDHTTEGTPLSVFAGSERARPVEVQGLSLGKRVTVPEPATVLSRFPKRKKS